MVKKPCIGCIYFKACGNTSRTEPCEGRKTKSQIKKEYEVAMEYLNNRYGGV